MTRASADILRRPVRWAVIARHLGQLFMVLAALVSVPLLLALRYGRTELALRYLAVIAVLVATGFLLARVRSPRRIQVNEAMIIASSTFLVAPVLMAFPLMSLGLGFLDAWFEAVSGVTTTGLSVVENIEARPETFLISRAWMQWYGGLGIVVLSLALVLRPGVLARRLAVAEALEDDLLGGTRAHARQGLVAYCAISGLAILVIWLSGADGLSAFTYGMAAVSTGGFAPHDASLAALGAYSQAAVTVFCLAGAVPLVWYHRVSRGDWGAAVSDPQVRALLLLAPLSCVALFTTMYLLGDVPVSRAAWDAPIMALSAQSTAGFSSLDPGALDDSSKLILILTMAIGGSAGSTAGGIKILRVILLARVVQGLIVRTTLPRHAVWEPRLGRRRIEKTETQEALILMILFLSVVLVSWLAFLVAGFPALDSLFEVVSATGTVGLSSGVSHAALPDALKTVLCIDMLMGRLEIIPLLVIAYPRTWTRNRSTSQ